MNQSLAAIYEALEWNVIVIGGRAIELREKLSVVVQSCGDILGCGSCMLALHQSGDVSFDSSAHILSRMRRSRVYIVE